MEGLKKKGLRDELVIEAMLKVPRHQFVDTAFVEHAYEDKAFPIAAGQTISHPSTVAMQSQLLEISPGMKVLEIGTGSGFQAAHATSSIRCVVACSAAARRLLRWRFRQR